MREVLHAHGHTFTGGAVMIVLALLMGNLGPGPALAAAPITSLPKAPILLPDATDDADGDSFADDLDLYQGNLHLRIQVDELDLGRNGLPRLLVGTQDDQWRTGRDGELAWPHIVDHDPFGNDPGSPGWWSDALRTGSWRYSIPMADAEKALAPTGRVDGPMGGVTWPQVFHLDVRDDRRFVGADLELYDVAPDPDRRVADWHIEVDVVDALWRIDDGPWHATSVAQTAQAGAASMVLSVSGHAGIAPAEAQHLVDQWAPRLHFDSDEAFYPVPGDLLQRFHGFAEKTVDHRTWTRDFTNGRDGYVLHLADFNGDRVVDHQDALALTAILEAGGLTPPTIYARASIESADQVVIQYWFLSIYNFVRGEQGEDIEVLAHAGDREFIQLTFTDLDAARSGWPTSISYSQHYKGIRVPVVPGEAPFGNGTHPDVYVAAGSHASYPAPGDDRRFRPAFAGFGDFFDGQGRVWEPGTATVELLAAQPFHQGHLWGPFTRHHRDLGTALKPLLQHSFTYAFQDPITWQHSLRELQPHELADAYGEVP